MTIFLTSSPCIPNADRALLNPANGFVARLRTVLPPRPRCLFICSSPDDPEKTDRYANDMRMAFSEAGMPLGQLGVLDGRNAVEAEALIHASDFIILAGGHVPTQNAFFQKIHLRQLLADYGGTVMGVSAGSMNAASTVYVQPELEGESIDPAFERFVPGLGLTEVKILPHYQQIKDWLLDGKRLFEDITYPDSMGQVFHALPDGSYLFGTGRMQRIFGECYCISDGQISQACANGETLLMMHE